MLNIVQVKELFSSISWIPTNLYILYNNSFLFDQPSINNLFFRIFPKNTSNPNASQILPISKNVPDIY